MCISGIESSSLILNQIKYCENSKYDARKMQKYAEAKRDGVTLTSVNFKHWNH